MRQAGPKPGYITPHWSIAQMAEYRVTLWRRVRQTAITLVDAESEKEALECAFNMADELRLWEDDGVIGEDGLAERVGEGE